MEEGEGSFFLGGWGQGGGVLGEKKEERRSGLRTVSAYAKGEVSQIRPWPWE